MGRDAQGGHRRTGRGVHRRAARRTGPGPLRGAHPGPGRGAGTGGRAGGASCASRSPRPGSAAPRDPRTDPRQGHLPRAGPHHEDVRDPAGLPPLRVEVIDLATSGTPPVKTRVRADDSTLLRFDTDADPLPLGPLPDAARTRLADAAAVLVCDYGRGITSHDGLRQALTAAAGDRPLVWDPHPKGTTPTPGTALAVPNTDEALRFTGHDGPRSLAGDTARAIQLLAAWPVKQVAVIRGRDGAVLVADADGHPLAVPARPAAGDTCGAGDQLAVTAAMTLAAGRLPSHAIAAAVNAATDYVAAGGPATPATHEPSDTTGPLELAARVRARGGRVVGAGGCFDLLHAGHLSLLNHARRLGDVLIVCINSDASVRRLKGADRPVVGERERAALLTALDCVDHVPVFAEDTPEKVLAELRPDVWGKGGDYAGQRIAEADLVESWGGEVVTVPFLEGHSTTTRIRHLAQQAGAR
ncbi:PfkB family carbohydrate kinase [Streptomyces olivaceoviridis]|uniref:PfkB family carbohydrate kinase n=1 Tax=Streptomyces olivaceoviridis TaxID=1921 RepID=UPI0033A59933